MGNNSAAPAAQGELQSHRDSAAICSWYIHGTGPQQAPGKDFWPWLEDSGLSEALTG